MSSNFIRQKLKANQDSNLERILYPISKHEGNNIEINNKLLINFTSNDYLSLASCAKVKKALISGIELYGFGSCASPLISGYSKHHQLLEEKFAKFLNYDQAIFFNSGYHANTGIIAALAENGTTIILDKLCHASIIDGIKLSGVAWKRYGHNNLVMAEELLINNKQNLVISESVFSMEGNIAPIDKLAVLSKKYNATLIVDDAHGIGILGATGRGISQFYNLTKSDIQCLVMPLGKAFGACGAIVAGSSTLINYLRQHCRSYIYSTSLPPAIPYACLEVLNIIQQEGFRREKLVELIAFFIKHAQILGLPLTSYDLTPIKCIIINCNKKVVEIQHKLKELGYFISAIRSPTVPKSTSRLRISLNFMHNNAQILELLQLIAKEYES